MKIGFIGAGKAGCSLASYFISMGEEIAGFYSPHNKVNMFRNYSSVEEVADNSELLIVSVKDDAISDVWHDLKNKHIKCKTVCHLSGSLTSSVFDSPGEISVCSMHPLLAFNSVNTPVEAIGRAYFTLEGDDNAVRVLSDLLERCGNRYKVIKAENKTLYHAAACFVSNFVTAVCAEGFSILEKSCGFTDKEAQEAFGALIEENARNVCKNGIKGSLTGPVSRGDAGTVIKHMKALSGREKEIYKMLSEVLAEESGHRELLSVIETEKSI